MKFTLDFHPLLFTVRFHDIRRVNLRQFPYAVFCFISGALSRGGRSMLWGLMLAMVAATVQAARSPEDAFALDGSKCIIQEEHFGIVNGKMTLGVNHTDVAAVQGLWAPPYASSDFALGVTADGQTAKTEQYTWRPHHVTRTGRGAISTTDTWLAPGLRGGAITMKFTRDAPVAVSLNGTLDRVEFWEFARAASSSQTRSAPFENGVIFRQGALAIVVLVSGADAEWDAARGCLTFHGRNERSIAFAIGPESEAIESARAIAAAPARWRDQMRLAAVRETNDLFSRLPVFEADNEAWVRFYNRSLVHLIMNRWEVPEFVLHPYYLNFQRAAALCDWAGKPMPALRERAAALKGLLKQTLWDPAKKWFCFLDGKGNKEWRFTLQIFKLFGSDVLDPEQEAGLLSHLNEVEFLSPYGLHSLAKTDPAYDPADIDNGGPGACTCFPPQIAERLYKAGHPAPADDLLRRCLWWGDRMPYWGDSLVADKIDYRKDTPLQCTLDGVTVAQCIIFGLFGVRAEADGRVIVNPHLPVGVKWMKLNHLKLRGHTLTIEAGEGTYRVLLDSASRPLGQPTAIPKAK